MLLCLVILCSLLQLGQPQSQCTREVKSLKEQLQAELREAVRDAINTSLTREDIVELLEDKATKKDVFKLKDEFSAGTNFMKENQNSTIEGIHRLVRNVTATKEDIQALRKKVAKENELVTRTLLVDQSVKRNELVDILNEKATKKDIRKRADEVVETLNASVATGNKHLMETLHEIVETQEGIKNATKKIGQEFASSQTCVTRAELGVVASEIQSLTQLVTNNTEMLQELVAKQEARGTYNNPASSCKKIPRGNPSGYYWIQSSSKTPVKQLYCDVERGWMRITNLDMTDANQQCPIGFRLVSSPRRSCGVLEPGCTSITYLVHGVEYSKVCGRVTGYQKGSPDGFFRSRNIDSQYVDGVSLTHGSSPRKHIWTFVVAIDESRRVCSCIRPDLQTVPYIPSFVGNDYFCDSGSRNRFEYDRFYHEDPLWDGQGCGSRSTCCSFNNPPWFCKELPQPTRDNIELRLCRSEDQENEDITLEAIELYVE